eukprot:22866-Amphidinium_carterae.1
MKNSLKAMSVGGWKVDEVQVDEVQVDDLLVVQIEVWICGIFCIVNGVVGMPDSGCRCSMSRPWRRVSCCRNISGRFKPRTAGKV